VVVAVGLVTWAAVREGESPDAAPPVVSARNGLGPLREAGVAEVGDLAPDFELATLDGGSVRLSELRGTPVVLNFWASWCTPCREEFPVLRAAHRAADGEYAVVGVDTDDIRSDATDFAVEQRARWPNGFDADGEVAKRYGVIAKPQTFVIDGDGVITARLLREVDAESLADALSSTTS
jgi:cytochrome c biogenesis protein CcmG, thiol:disulfide interchange protein DsbE